LQATLLMGPSGLIAMLAGWFVTEVGRQPYTVYGLLRTADSVSPIGTPAVGASLLAIVVVYLFVFGAGVWYLLKLMARPPDEPAPVSALADATHAAGITPAAGLPARERQH
jgi:cytochrome d ubiquinol oxidase subunit I